MISPKSGRSPSRQALGHPLGVRPLVDLACGIRRRGLGLVSLRKLCVALSFTRPTLGIHIPVAIVNFALGLVPMVNLLPVRPPGLFPNLMCALADLLAFIFRHSIYLQNYFEGIAFVAGLAMSRAMQTGIGPPPVVPLSPLLVC